ncbi:MAG: glycosyltransferase family 39 protein [Solirubrobacteraceae bacterium]
MALSSTARTPPGPPRHEPGARNGRSQTRWMLAAGAIVLLALVLRIAFVETTSFKSIDDAGTYNRLGSQIAQLGDYKPSAGFDSGAGGTHGPTAYFPPAYPYFVALVDIIDGHQAGGKTALLGIRLGGAVLGAVAVGLLGLVALEAFGADVALGAMALAAAYPVFVELAGTIVAENLLVVFMLASVWTALRARRSPRPLAWVAATGVLGGLATLSHENAAIFVIPLTAAAAGAAGPSWRRRLIGALTLLVATAAMIAPWTIRNAVELHHFIPVADETGITLRGTYNEASASFDRLPYKWRFYWSIPQDAGVKHRAFHEKEVPLSGQLESRALHYIGRHPGAPFHVFWSNLRRMFELRGSYAWHQSAHAIGLHESDAQVGVIAFWVLCALAIAGLFTQAARRAPPWLWSLPILYALSILFVNVETPRFREPIDPFLLLLAACAVSTAVRYVRSRIRLEASRPATL